MNRLIELLAELRKPIDRSRRRLNFRGAVGSVVTSIALIGTAASKGATGETLAALAWIAAEAAILTLTVTL